VTDENWQDHLLHTIDASNKSVAENSPARRKSTGGLQGAIEEKLNQERHGKGDGAKSINDHCETLKFEAVSGLETFPAIKKKTEKKGRGVKRADHQIEKVKKN